MRPSINVGDSSFAIATAFLFGVFAANSGWNLYALGAGEFFCAVGIMLFFRAHGNGIKKYAIFFLAASAAGVFYYYGYMHWQAIRINMPHGTQGAFFGIVAQEPKAAGNFTMLTVDLSHPYSGSLDIFTSPDNTRFHYGDDLWIKGSVSPSDAMGELPAMFLPQVRVVVSHQGFWLKEALIDFKDAIAQAIARIVPPDQAALLAGILIGTTGTMSAALKAQMDISGTSYIVGMYGYKIAIITAVLAAALKDHLSRKMLLCATLGTIALFVLASGATISAVRAAIMGSFAIIARGTGRVFNARNAIVFTAVGMVLLNATLLTDAAFQLSFLSFLGIYYLGPPINNYFHWTTGGVLQWKEHAMLSLSTNLAILPIVMNTFGAFSLTSFISNILIMIPWVAVISFGALAVILNIISPVLAFCVVQIVSLLLRYELLIIRIFATVVIPLPAIFGSAWVIALYYAVLILFIYYYAAPSQKNN